MPDSIRRINKYNKSPISLREGKVFLDGLEIMDSVKCKIVFKPDVWSGKQLGEDSQSRRWLGKDIEGSITQRRSTAWLKNAIKSYIETKKTPEFTIQGIMDDKGSDYYATDGSNVITAVGCVLTGDITLIELDSGGDIFNDELSFGAYDVIL